MRKESEGKIALQTELAAGEVTDGKRKKTAVSGISGASATLVNACW